MADISAQKPIGAFALVGIVLSLTLCTVALAAGAAVSPLYTAAALAALAVLAASIQWPQLVVFLIGFTFYANLGSIMAVEYQFPVFTELLLVLMMGVLLLRYMTRGELGVTLRATFIVFIAYMALLCVSLFRVFDFTLFTEEMIDLVQIMIVALMVVAIITDSARFEALVNGIIAGAIVMCAAAIAQNLTGTYWSNWGGFAEATVHHIAGDTSSWRASGPLSDSNHFGQILLIALPICLARAMWGPGTLWRLIGLGAVVMLIWAIFLTFSRGTLGAMVICLAMYFWHYRKIALVLALPVGFLVWLSPQYLPGDYADRVAVTIQDVRSLVSDEGHVVDPAANGRLAEMIAAWKLFLENPVLGVGFSQYEAYYQDTAQRYSLMARDSDRQAHSLYLEILSERGIIGAVSFLGLIGFALYSGAKTGVALRAQGRINEAELLRGVIFGFIGYLVASALLHDSYSSYFWISVAALAAAPNLVARWPGTERDASDSASVEQL